MQEYIPDTTKASQEEEKLIVLSDDTAAFSLYDDEELREYLRSIEPPKPRRAVTVKQRPNFRRIRKNTPEP